MLYKPPITDLFYRQNKVLEPVEAIKKFNNTESKIIFVSGAFDIIHLGHLAFLRNAKEAAGENAKLLVVLHSDQIIKEKKGEDRPYMNIKERIEIISELKCVDYVIEWEGWENIIEFAESIKPRYFAVTEKSYEYSRKGKWIGPSWEIIAKNIGAEIIRIPINRDYSSSNYRESLM